MRTNAQFIDVVTFDSTENYNIKSMAFYQNDLFFTSGNKIYKLDTDQVNSVPTEFIAGLNGADGLVVINNYLYVISAGEISKIDLTQPTPSLITVVSNLEASNVGQLANIGNVLYFTRQLSSTGTAIGELYKIDISLSNPTPTLVRDDLFQAGGAGLATKGNDLYMIDSSGMRRMNTITSQTVTIHTASYFFRMAFNNDDLYISSVQGNSIHKFNFNNNTIYDLYDSSNGLTEPEAIVFKDNSLYISNVFGSEIIKTANPLLSLIDFNIKIKIKIYPNPASTSFKILGLNKKINFTIYNSLGQKISKGIISDNGKIDIKNLINGIYFLKTENGITLKFIKK